MSEKTENKKREKCLLNRVNGIDAWCSRDRCIYWRLLDAQDQEYAPSAEGCGLQHFGIVDEVSPEMAEWLLTMKRKLENTTPEAGKARITFRRREEE